MADTALKNAQKRADDAQDRIAKAEQELAEARAELAAATAFIQAWYDFANVPVPHADVKPVNIAQNVGKASARALNPSKEVIAEAARDIIEARGMPVPRALLLQLLNDRGISIYGKDPEMVLSTMLWRMPERVVRLKPHGYWLPEKPYRPAGYDPATSLIKHAYTLLVDQDE